MLSRLLARLRSPRGIQSQWMMTSGGLKAAVAFGSNLVLVRFISPDSFGHFAITFAALGMVLATLSLRLGVQVIRLRDSELDHGQDRQYFSAMLYEALLASAVAIGWLAYSDEVHWLSLLLLGAVMLRHFVNNALSFYEREQPYKHLAIIEGGTSLFAHALAAALAIGGAGEAALYLREAALTLASAAWLTAVGGIRWQRLCIVWPRDWLRLARQARGIWLDGVFVDGLERVAVLLAGLFGGDRGAGYFFQARRLAQFPHQLLGPLADRLGFNWFSRATDVRERRRSLVRVLVSVSIPLVLAAVSAVALADPVVPWIFGEPWRPAVNILIAISGMIVFWTPLTVLRSYLIATRRTRNLLVARVVQLFGMLLPLGIAWQMDWARDAELIGVCVSSAYAVAFLAAAVAVWRGDDAPEDRESSATGAGKT